MPEVRDALDLDPRTPIVMGDLRQRLACRDLLVALVDHLMSDRSPLPEPPDRRPARPDQHLVTTTADTGPDEPPHLL